MGIPENCCVLLLSLCLLICVVCTDGAPPVRPQCPTEPGVHCRPDESSGLGEYAYSVEGERVRMELASGGYFSVQCSGNVSLVARSLPRFSAALRVAAVTLQGCRLAGSDASYAGALARLNVTVLTKLAIYDATRDEPLRRSHFTALGGLAELAVEARAGPEPEGGFLAELAGLRSLRLEGLRLRAGELERLPPRLENLHLVYVGVDTVTRAALARLPLLRVLTVRDVIKVEIESNESRSLRAVTVDAPGAAAPVSAWVERVTVWRWGERAPAAWSACARLGSLQVVLPAADALPPRWVARCERLSSLLVSRASLSNRTLPEDLLEGAAELIEFNVTWSRLLSLPRELFEYSPKLRTINLSHNELLTLPSDIFAPTRKLVTLELSFNNLSQTAVLAVSSLTSLRQLHLAYNPLGDLCGGGSDRVQTKGLSELHRLTRLEQLSLGGAGLARVCLDWRDSMPRLAALDLSNNRITHLMYEDLQFPREVVDARVDLTGNNVSTVEYHYADYYNVRIGAGRDAQGEKAAVTLDSVLRCDCLVYWTARALRERAAHVRVGGLRCARGVPLVDAPLEDMECAAEGCPARCACGWRPRAPLGRAARRVVRVRCAAAGLAAPPALPPAARRDPHTAWELLLANNSIRHLHPEDLPKDLLVLDLRNNSVRSVEAAAVGEVFSRSERRVLLAGNPLECGCGLALPPALRLHRAMLDYDALTCADGGGDAPFDAHAPTEAECARRARITLGLALAGGLLPVALALAALAAWLSRPSLRLAVKAALAARGWLPRALDPHEADADAEGAGRRYDAFVSHSHRDETVAREVVARLERAGYRVCVHYRDWAPGAWIPDQIAESVRSSRRTVALVSEHFLESRWACAEFRAAHAAALRAARPALVAVVVGAVPRASLARHPDLRAFLDSNTYVEWTDPWFWEKLMYAMPRLPRRGRAADPPTAAADPPTAAADPPTAGADPPTAAADPPTAGADPPTAAADSPSATCDVPRSDPLEYPSK